MTQASQQEELGEGLHGGDVRHRGYSRLDENCQHDRSVTDVEATYESGILGDRDLHSEGGVRADRLQIQVRTLRLQRASLIPMVSFPHSVTRVPRLPSMLSSAYAWPG